MRNRIYLNPKKDQVKLKRNQKNASPPTFSPLDHVGQKVILKNHYYTFCTPQIKAEHNGMQSIINSFSGAGKKRAKDVLNFMIWSQITYTAQNKRKKAINKYNYSIRFSQEYLAKKFNCTREWINTLISRMELEGYIAKYRTYWGTCFYKVSSSFFKYRNIIALSKTFTSLKILLVTQGFGKKLTLIESFKELLNILFNIKIKRIQNEHGLTQDNADCSINSEKKSILLTSIASLGKSMSI